MTARYVLGMDLGTTNSVVAYAPLDAEQLAIQLLPIPQLVDFGTLESLESLPSFLYLGRAEETAAGSLDLAWADGRTFCIGQFARRQAAEVPDRTVGAAKSWLCHSRIDRHQPVLPWNAPDDVPKVSPVMASRRYLEHLVAAWEAAFPDAPVAEQQVVLTVPASFDASARELTREAALAAGLPADFVLIEEPQAAVYAWLAATGERWRKVLGVGDKLLVCDVGGGTTDLTLVGVSEEDGELALQRLAVGNHLLVGGDNMDLALAHHVAGQFAAQGVKLNPWQSVSLWHSCRNAKEALLSAGGPETQSISVLGRGSRLVGGTISVEVNRQAVQELLIEGFFPDCSPADRPARRRASGFREIGLPFEADTAVTRHLAAFLQAHGSGGQSVQPTRILFNGGVFKSDALQARLLDVVGSWFGGACPETLAGIQDLDFAVARGAAHYGWVKQKGGVRIRGGTARSYYVGIETAGPAIPGAPRPMKALCVVPIGMEEGTEADVPGEEIGLVVGESARFRFFSSSTRRQDRPGDLLDEWDAQEIEETDSMETELPAGVETEEDCVPVRFHSRVTELGMLELWCVGTAIPGRWKLEFSVREDAET
ncbi:MAG: Hsp70 family protein [Pirellulaceae bacterium]|jgi:molecular chaperone DnaK (HSP70)|nr:Hsp70 family protein [Thermoguttaceae bacterium]MDI9445608.1 Hsp70 family protein [Planctomycetota bacterium]NLY99367.1 Hsp70 family protein [Pirellulaceae bacterium]